MRTDQSRNAQLELETTLPSPLIRHGRLLIKNDGETGATYGGNKLRKLPPLFAHLKRQGLSRIVTVGAAGSHHVLATALLAPSDVEVTALLFPQPNTPHVAKVLRAMIATRARLIPTTRPLSALQRLGRMLGPGTCWVGPGAMGPLASTGYDRAFAEWLKQRAETGRATEAFEQHVVAAGSGGTAAGLLFGMVSRGVAGRVIAVAVNHNPTLRHLVLAQAHALGRLAGTPVSASALAKALVVERSAVGRGYGYPTLESEIALEQASQCGLTLEHTYTGKAFAIAQRLAADTPRDTVVFWQTVSQRPMPAWLADGPPMHEWSAPMRALLLDHELTRA